MSTCQFSVSPSRASWVGTAETVDLMRVSAPSDDRGGPRSQYRFCMRRGVYLATLCDTVIVACLYDSLKPLHFCWSERKTGSESSALEKRVDKNSGRVIGACGLRQRFRTNFISGVPCIDLRLMALAAGPLHVAAMHFTLQYMLSS